MFPLPRTKLAFVVGEAIPTLGLAFRMVVCNVGCFMQKEGDLATSGN